MAHGMTRREFAMTASAASLAVTGFGSRARGGDAKTLRFVMRNDLRVLDPMWTNAYVTRNHGYMVFDTLFALDAQFVPRPQMVGEHAISADNLVYSFRLRDGLRFHDAQPVLGADCVTSLKRWMARDSLGQTLATVVEEMPGTEGSDFTIRLKEPFPLLLAGLAKGIEPAGPARRHLPLCPLSTPGCRLRRGGAESPESPRCTAHPKPVTRAKFTREVQKPLGIGVQSKQEKPCGARR